MSAFSLVNIGGAGPKEPVVFKDMCGEKEAKDLFVDTAGDRMTGELSMSKNRITYLPLPINPTDSGNKAYVDKIKSIVVSRVIPSVSSFKTRIEGLIKKTADNSRHVTGKYTATTKEITDLRH